MNISVIIPVYNTSKYLIQCLDSVLSQTFKEIEVILINDGSTNPKTEKICNKYYYSYNNIKYIKKESNEGVEKARLDGLSVAEGKYIFFLDSDDWLDNNNVLEDLYLVVEECDADYVEIGMQRVLDSNKFIKSHFKPSKPVTIEYPQLFDEYFISFFGVNKISVNIWGKLYRKSTLDKSNIRPLGLSMGEDLAFNIQLFPFLKKIVFLNKPGYNYRIGGMTSRYNTHFLQDMKKLFQFKLELIEKYDYHKADPWVRYELKNVLRTEIFQRIQFKMGDKNEIIDFISKEIESPEYRHLYEIGEEENFWKQPFVIAYRNKDAETMYEIQRKEVRRNYPRYLLKKLFSL